MMRLAHTKFLLLTLAVAANSHLLCAEDEKPIPIAEVKHDGPVDFEKEVLPILRKNCLACHNSTTAESELVLETPQSILKGGADGPGAVAGKGAESLIVLLAARQRESFMPPDDNDVGAKQLTSEELGLLKLWIDQGAKGEVTGSAAIKWQPLPAGVNPIYSVAITEDGQYAAAGRANQVFLYHVPSHRELGRLTDPAVLKSGVYSQPGVAHLDLVQAVAFSPNGELLATGGFRTAKIWRRAAGKIEGAQPADFAAAVKSMAMSGDGKVAVFGLEDKSALVVELASGKTLHTLSGHEGPVTAVAISADGAAIATGSDDKSVKLWGADGKEVGVIATPDAVSAVLLAGDFIVTGGPDKTVRVWKHPAKVTKEEGKEEPQLLEREIPGHGGPVTSLSLLNDTQIVSGSDDGTARIWNLADGKAIRSITHGGPVKALAVQPGGAMLATASDNKSVKLWETASGKMTFELKGHLQRQLDEAAAAREVALAAELIKLAEADLKAGNDRKAAEEANQKKAEEAVTKAKEEHVKKVEAEKKPTADKLAADKALADAKTNAEKAEAAIKPADEAAAAAAKALTDAQAAAKAATDAATAAAKAHTDAVAAQKAAADAADKDKENKDLAKAKEDADKKVTEAEAKKKEADEAKAAADKAATDAAAKKTEADTAKAAAAKGKTDADAAVKAADAKAKAAEAPAKKATDELTAATRTLETAERSVERAKQAVVKAGEEIPKLEAIVKDETGVRDQKQKLLDEAKQQTAGAEQAWLAVAFSADGKTVAAGGSGSTVHTWDVATGTAMQIYNAEAAVTGVGFAADGRLTAVAGAKTSLWNVAVHWDLLHTIGTLDDKQNPFADRVTALAFSPDGKVLATGSGEPSRSGEIKLWNVEDAKLIRELKEPHSDTVFGLEFSRDGQYLASCAADRFMKVFQVSDGEFVRAFEGHTHHVLGVSWSANGRTLATSGADMVIKVWDFRSGDQQRTITGFS
ncbi:MAG: hypothetical protein KDB14_13980, partial [Planctomycetales bacterium]|nr:hypothetical protein [Planctomycetales bacterium]